MIGHHLMYSSSYNRFIILRDSNIEMEEQQIKAFCDNYSLKSLIGQPTCYKSPSNPTFIALIPTYLKKSRNTCVMEVRLLDFHLMTVTL